MNKTALSVQASPAKTSNSPFARAMAALDPLDIATHPRLREAAGLAQRGQFEAAIGLTQCHLRSHPEDASGWLSHGEIFRRLLRYPDAEKLFATAVERDPQLSAARFHYANALLETGKPQAALAQAEILLQAAPSNPVFRALKAMALELLDEHAAAASLWVEVVAEPAPPECWLRYAHVLRVLGRREDAIAACQQAIADDPSYGPAWWALAGFKTYRFSAAEIAQMERTSAKADLASANRIPLLFALGKAYADLGQYQKSFAFYARGNALRRAEFRHDPAVFTAYVDRCKHLLTEEFFRARDGFGCRSEAPIFLVGMLRSGSTLAEQILASHSQVEGTRELYGVGAIAAELERERAPRMQLDYPAVLQTLSGKECAAFGERYLESAWPHRKLGRPFFVDKMGNNFVHLGLIQLILPHAKIVDVRRQPLACGLANFTQLYANGQKETYRLAEFGAYYRDYAELMAHFGHVLPGRVHRLDYERLVADPENEIRRLLAYLGLPFEESCLAFHANARAVSTISSEQVRAPIYDTALGYWRYYEAWLGPLKAALGPALDCWR